MELEAFYVDGSITTFHRRDAWEVYKVIARIEMGLSFTDAMGGEPTEQMLNYIVHVNRFKIERQNIRNGFAHMGGSSDNEIVRVG